METLYHYTTVETLLLILKNKTLRFKSLLFVDDPLEPTTSDFGNLGKFKYVSCWTDSPNSIPQWNMYGDNIRGVCLSISFDDPKDIFLTEKFSFPNSTEPIDVIPLLHPSKSNLIVTNNSYIPILESVQYTNDPTLTTPSVVSTSDTHTSINLVSNGIYKTTEWSFQNEKRFSFQIFPLTKLMSLKIMEESKGDPSLLLSSYSFVEPKEYFDLEINSTIFDKFTIIFGKRCSAEDKLKVTKFLEDNKLDIPLFDSSVNIKP
ncbi:DUF2971 domain-containing protein [Streptococcus dysgalactiae]|uniref:DUF2971 domain-containing protein n=1 Tax=Streptococcus dysgalactiae TaxID=1334 RepID=UPI003DA13047